MSAAKCALQISDPQYENHGASPDYPGGLSTHVKVLFFFSFFSLFFCFLVSSNSLIYNSLSACHQRLDYLTWSPYLDDCLKQLDETNEAPNDKLLVHLVKIHLVTDQSVQLYSRLHDTDTEESTRFLGQYIVSLRQQLKNVREQTPPHLVSSREFSLSLSLSLLLLILIRFQAP